MTTPPLPEAPLSLGAHQVLAKVRANLFDAPIEAHKIGPYTILERVGAGGMGTVFAAYDPDLDRRVAVKVLRRDRMGDERAGERFVREGRTLARLTHPNVLSVFGAGDSDHGPYLAMELVEGRDLDVWLRETKRAWPDVARVFIQAARGLQAVHTAGIVHRDFKPSNVLLADDGRVLVADFGLARAPTNEDTMDIAVTSTSGTATEGPVGTPMFMSPEQREHLGVTAASDQYSFCVAMQHALQDVEDVPRAVEAALERGLEEDPDARWPSMEALTEALDDARRGPGHRWKTFGVAALVAGTLGAFVWSSQGDSPLPCDGAGQPIAELWTEDAKASVAKHPDTATKLETHANAWTDIRTKVCEDRTRGLVSRPLTEARVSCLERGLGGFEDAVQLASVAAHGADAQDAIDNLLEDPGRCLEPESSHFTTWRHPDPEVRRLGDEVIRNASRLWAASNTSRSDEVASLTQRLERELPTLIDPTPRGIVARVLGHRTNDNDLRESRFRQAMEDGIRSRNDELVVKASLDLSSLLRKRRDFEGALHALDLCQASIDRLQTYADAHDALRNFSPLLQGKLYNKRGVVHLDLGEYAEARDAFRAALVEWKGHAASQRLLAENNLGEALRGLGHYDDAVEGYGRALRLAQEEVDGDHAWIAAILMNRGNARLQSGQVEAAAADIEPALAMAKRLSGNDLARTAATELDTVPLRLARGDLDTAADILQRCADHLERTLAPNDPYWVKAPLFGSQLARARGNVEQALPMAEHAFAAAQRIFGPEHPETAVALIELSTSRLALHELDGVASDLERARTIVDAKLGPDGYEARLLRGAEQALARTRGP